MLEREMIQMSTLFGCYRTDWVGRGRELVGGLSDAESELLKMSYAGLYP